MDGTHSVVTSNQARSSGFPINLQKLDRAKTRVLGVRLARPKLLAWATFCSTAQVTCSSRARWRSVPDKAGKSPISYDKVGGEHIQGQSALKFGICVPVIMLCHKVVWMVGLGGGVSSLRCVSNGGS